MNRQKSMGSGRYKSTIELEYRIPASSIAASKDEKKKMREVGQRIRQQRELCGYSVRRLSDKCHISRARWLQFELGRATPEPKALILIAKMLGTTTKCLREGETTNLLVL